MSSVYTNGSSHTNRHFNRRVPSYSSYEFLGIADSLESISKPFFRSRRCVVQRVCNNCTVQGRIRIGVGGVSKFHSPDGVFVMLTLLQCLVIVTLYQKTRVRFTPNKLCALFFFLHRTPLQDVSHAQSLNSHN